MDEKERLSHMEKEELGMSEENGRELFRISDGELETINGELDAIFVALKSHNMLSVLAAMVVKARKDGCDKEVWMSYLQGFANQLWECGLYREGDGAAPS